MANQTDFGSKGNFWPGFSQETLDDIELVQINGRQKVKGPRCWTRITSPDRRPAYLQKCLDELLASDPLLTDIFERLKKSNLSVVIIGGWVRDLLLMESSNNGPIPHDVDMVVIGAGHKRLETILPEATKRTVFGGFSYIRDETSIDLWPLTETFLANKYSMPPSLDSLLAVTDFNINTIIFCPEQFSEKPTLIDGGCLQSLQSRQIDFNFEWVPMPAVQVARVVHFAAKLRFSLNEEVRRFIVSTCSSDAVRNLVIANLEQHCLSQYRPEAMRLLDSMVALPKTRHFAHCLGVFEGGGVRAAAFAGAYAAARKAGVCFSQVAGTSGGSIAAAFVATGASPEEIRKQLFKINLKELSADIDTTQRFGKGRPWIMAWLRHFKAGRIIDALTLNRFGGLHSSAKIEDWVDNALKELLKAAGRPVERGPVTFNDLPIPLYVVASDLVSNRHKVWSKKETGRDSVAKAVRCSCTIPLYFQPVVVSPYIYVDGGMLSNTPAFVFADEQINDPGKYSARTLAFRLIQQPKHAEPMYSFRNYMEAISNTIVDGASDIQRSLQGAVHAVNICTGDISSTDFERTGEPEKSFLFTAGFDAVKDFLESEVKRLFDLHPVTTFVGRDQKMLLFVQMLKDAVKEIVFIDHDSSWLYLIFPAVLLAAKRGIRISYLHFSCKDESIRNLDEQYRRKLLAGLGVNLIAVEKFPFVGCMMDWNETTGTVAVVEDVGSKDSFMAQLARTYFKATDSYVFGFLAASVAKHIPPFTPPSGSSTTPEFTRCSDQRLFDLLKTVPQYSRARFTVERVDINSNLFAIQSFVKEYKYLQTDDLIEEFRTQNIDLFIPVEVNLPNGTSTIITPPILEASGSDYTIIEGHARAFQCYRVGMDSFNAVVVRGVDHRLPTKPQPFCNLTIASRTLKEEVQFNELEKHLWRKIEPKVHPTLL